MSTETIGPAEKAIATTIATAGAIVVIVFALIWVAIASAFADDRQEAHVHGWEWRTADKGVMIRGIIHNSKPCVAYEKVHVELTLIDKDTGETYGEVTSPHATQTLRYDELGLFYISAPHIEIEAGKDVTASYTLRGNPAPDGCA